MNSPRLAVYAHLYLIKNWRAILAEILSAMEASKLYLEIDALRMGMVGDRDEQSACVRQVQSLLPAEVVAAAPVGWEQLTLSALRADALRDEFDKVVYVHLKGVANPSPWADQWRTSMLSAVVGHWKPCQLLLNDVQVVTCHWLAPEQDLPHRVDSPYPAGNMWHARADYVATLPEPSLANRHEAEAWLGKNRPTVADLAHPGWPSYDTLFQAPR